MFGISSILKRSSEGHFVGKIWNLEQSLKSTNKELEEAFKKISELEKKVWKDKACTSCKHYVFSVGLNIKRCGINDKNIENPSAYACKAFSPIKACESCD